MSDWAERVKFLKKTEKLSLKPNSNPKSYLIYSPVPWVQGNIERMLSISLQLRGHSVDEIICGGDFPACGMEHVKSKRPECSACYHNALYIFDVWGTTPESTTAFRDPNDVETATNVVKSLKLGQYTDMLYKDFIGLNYCDFPLGITIYRQTHWYFSGNFNDSIAVLDYLEKCAVTYIIEIGIAKRLLNRNNYDALIVANGKTIESGAIIDVARSKGIRYITWEELCIFDNNAPVVEFNQYGVWESVKNYVLSIEEKQKIHNFMHDWKNSKSTRWIYYDNPIENFITIGSMLNLRENSFKVAVFPNMICDSSIIGMHVGFDSILDWIYTCIDYAFINSDIDLIIRCHPGEKLDLGFLSGNFSISEHLLKKYGRLPASVKLIMPNSEISSYALLQMADISVTYTGTLALEAPFYGKLCVLAGKSNLRGKGFTVDLASKDEMLALFDKRMPLRSPTAYEVELAYRYAYLYKLRMVANPDFYDKKMREFNLISLKILESEGHVFWDNLCESIEKNYAFIDLDKPDRIRIDLNALN